MLYKFIGAMTLMLIACSLHAQQTLHFKILDHDSKEPLVGATAFVKEGIGAVADTNGLLSLTVPENEITIRFSYVGYEAQTLTLSQPFPKEVITIFLEAGHETEEVIVVSTRASRNIENIPTRIETIGAEELVEKSVMRSTNIAMLLRESTGIQMQQTSATSANQSIRIQGLDGRYTQLLKDGFPLYSGFSGGLSIMQIPPLDLQQVEVIKGSSSTLYGGGAIAGLVNLVSIRPHKNELLTKLMYDQTFAGGSTLNAFHASRGEKLGITLFGSGHLQNAYDPNDDDFSNIPEIQSLSLNPVLYYYPNNKSELRLALNGSAEERLGGDMTAIEKGPTGVHQFLEENLTNRFSYQASYNTSLKKGKLEFKNSLTYFDRKINEPGYQFHGEQWASFSEASFQFGEEGMHWVTGLNAYTDSFKDQLLPEVMARDYEHTTLGIFAQNTWDISSTFALESGFRLDHHNEHGWFALPKASLLIRFNEKFTSRIGGGFGYKPVTIFTEEAERFSFRGVRPILPNGIQPERSHGANVDFNYKTFIGEKLTLKINQLFYYTQLKNQTVLGPIGTDEFLFSNGQGVRSKGMETNIQLAYDDFKLFVNYALIDAEERNNSSWTQKPYTAKHNLGAVLVFEQHGKWRVGFEAYYTGEQLRRNLTRYTDDYWMVGFMALRNFGKISAYINFENFTDTRQSRFENLNIGSHSNPDFIDIWAPTDGFIINTGVILELGDRKSVV